MSNYPLPSQLDSISQVIIRLRAMTQASVQSTWHYLDEDLSIAQALHSETWQTASIAELNSKGHLAWAKGRKVRWLTQTLQVPSTLQGYPLQGLGLRLALMWWAEAAQIFVDGQLVQEGDLFDCSTRLLLRQAVQPGEEVAIALRLVSPGHDDGALVRSTCLYESLQGIPEPGFIADELAVLQQYLSTFAPEHLSQLNHAVDRIDWSDLHPSLLQLRRSLLPLSDLIKQRQLSLLGHAHLDMAWLWRVEDTWRAAERTFESVLHLQSEFPELTFCHSTPALYDWVEQHRPALFQQIQRQANTGRWEVVGGLWIEPELNLISGEAIVRQVLYGQHYYQTRFGSFNRIAWLPDSFGFNWQLPQILKQGGIDYFVTQKLRWNDTTQFPYDLFWWQAPDGSQILSVMSAPIGEGIDPIKMTIYGCDWEQKTGLTDALWLPGVGDHGGGPTRDMLELAQRWQQSPFFPQLTFTTALNYLSQLEQVVTSKAGQPLPVWNSELYLEFHRGCYTTHADQKCWNRRSEELLYQAELWASLATIAAAANYPKAELAAAWKQVLFNQFHDILPGTSIPEVFVDANQAWKQVTETGWKIVRESLTAIAQQIDLPPPPHPDARAIVVFNALNWQRSQTLQLSVPPEALASSHWQVWDLAGKAIKCQQYTPDPIGKVTFFAEEIPGVGYRCFWLVPTEAALEVPSPSPSTTEFVLENDCLRVVVNPATGDIDSIWDKFNDREVLQGPGNQLQAFKDEGQYWDAWNIDPNYAQFPLPPAELIDIQYTTEDTTLEPGIRVQRKLGQSCFYQTYVLPHHAPIVEVRTQVEWVDPHVLVKAAFPLHVDADTATYEIPCGAIDRSTRPQDDRDRAKWEVPALRWANLGGEDYGVSLLNDTKQGYDVQPHQLRLTLLRGSEWPDPQADTGEQAAHAFRYALYPHKGNWQSAKTVHQGYEFNLPLTSCVRSAQTESMSGTLPPVGQLLNLGADNLILMSLKQSEVSPSEWIVRCYECHGKTAQLHLTSNLNLDLTEVADVLERSTGKIQGKPVTIHPWKIASFKAIATSH